MKTVKCLRRIITLILVLITALSAITVRVSAAERNNTARIYNMKSYMQISSPSVILRSEPKKIAKSFYALFYKGTVIKTQGTVLSEGKKWHKVKIASDCFYIPYTDAECCGNTIESRLFKVTTDNAPLRSQPYESGRIVEKLPENTLVRVVGEIKNQHGNIWYAVFSQGKSEICYMYERNLTSDYSTRCDFRLDQDVYFQTRYDTCSAASTLSVLRYANLLKKTSDTSVIKETDYCVGGVVRKLNKELGADTYKYTICKSDEKYERLIRLSLLQGSAPIARVSFSKKYFNYSSDGHYTTIIGIYEKNGVTWLELKDSYVNRNRSNNYSDKNSGTVHIPLKTLYNYGTYGGTSAIYLIHNP